MDVRFVTAGGVPEHATADLPTLLERAGGFTWVDVPAFDEEAERVMRTLLGCHPAVLRSCAQRNHVPSVHAYPAHFFTVLHAPLPGAAGHVHLLELDQLVGRHYLVTVHGPINPALDPALALTETDDVLRRIREGRFHPASPGEVFHAVVTAVARRQRELIGQVAARLPDLEQEVMAPSFRQPEALLDKLFLIRHELTTVRTMAAQSHDVFARITVLERHVPDADRELARDLADQFDRVRSVGDSETQFLSGVTELYQTRVHTKMTVAMERLAVIAAVTLPVTAIASVLGMNVIVYDRIQWWGLVVALLLMAVISAQLLRWARRQGWW